MRIIFFICLAAAIISCEQGPVKRHKIRNADTYSAEGSLQMVVEIPAGTNHKYEYDENRKKILLDQKDGQDRIIDFLPYPGNYGFIPNTHLDKDKGGDGDPLDVLLLSEALPLGKVVEIIPIGAILLKDNGEEDTKIIAVPKDSTLRVISATDFRTFLIEYDAAKRIIEEWFLHYKGKNQMSTQGWRDANYCVNLVKKTQK